MGSRSRDLVCRMPRCDTAGVIESAKEDGVGAQLLGLGCVEVTCPLKTNPNLERESKDSGVCKEAGNDEEAIHERTDYPQAEGSRS